MTEDEGLSRRAFLQVTGAGILAGPLFQAETVGAGEAPSHALEAIASKLLRAWGEALLRFQLREPKHAAIVGALYCPGCVRVHGRVGDTVYPFLRLARTTRDERFVEAARLVFGWMENMSRDDGSWVNDSISDWRGT